MRKRAAAVLILILATGIAASAQSSQTVKDYQSAVDSISVLFKERTGVAVNLSLWKVVRRGSTLDFHFGQDLVNYPWRDGDSDWLKERLKELSPSQYAQYKIGGIYARNLPVGILPMPERTSDGSPVFSRFKVNDPRHASPVVSLDNPAPSQGLAGRNISLWQSHGLYWEESLGRWEFQRAPTFRTVEDLYTQGYVIPFLIPMLENAGAYVLTPRERDIQTSEVICDNDKGFPGRRSDVIRFEGSYQEKGRWKDAGTGFGDIKEKYSPGENPFEFGTARMADALAKADATIRWRPSFKKRGRYAVYISYKTLPESTDCALYTVHHMGGVSRFAVNQTMGGGTWIYLGTFEFAAGDEGYVSLSNGTPPERDFKEGKVVTADAVRFGGGMGKYDLGEGVSGMPSYTEGALYSMRWGGAPESLFEDWGDEYTKDYAGRGKWTRYLAGGSRTNPDEPGLGIPIDLSLAFHSDAGITPNDSIVGTLAIYTRICDNSSALPTGEDRQNARLYCDFVQSQIVDDIRATFNPDWSRRGLWDRSYSESRTTGVPGMLLEILSHQNFGDMKYGLDPSFRFAVSRAVYKGMLKFLSTRYGCRYTVQPLPVKDFAAELRGTNAVLSWAPTEDPLEPTAKPDGFILYTRIDDGAFDGGSVIRTTEGEGGRVFAEIPVQPGRLYSFKVVPYNDGGKGFPGETLCVGIPKDGGPDVLVVNDFTRVGPPTWFDTPTYAGFLGNTDSGVPYINDITLTGEVFQYERRASWTDDDNPGFGGSYTDQAGKVQAGNTFDFAAVHGKWLMDAGYSVSSSSRGALSSLATRKYRAMDIIAGKQVSTPGRDSLRFSVFPRDIRNALTEYTSGGGNILISGAYIATDVWDRVYPVEKDSLETALTIEFVTGVLGYKWITNYPDRSGRAEPVRNQKLTPGSGISYNRDYSPSIYRVENPDGIAPSGKGSVTILRYGANSVSAATAYDSGKYRVVAVGFPLEAATDTEQAGNFFRWAMKYLTTFR